MSRGGRFGHSIEAPHVERGGANANREQAPPAKPVEATVTSRSRPPERTLYVPAILERFDTKLHRGAPVATGELPQATVGMAREFCSTLRRWLT